MKFLLIVTMTYLIGIRSPSKDRVDTIYPNKKECLEAKKEALKHNNELTKITAKCVPLKKASK